SDALQLCVFLFFLIYRFPPLVTLFPYTTLFRSEANLQGLPSANSFGYVSAEFHIHLKATVGYLGIYFFNTQRVTFSRKCELAFQDRKSTRLNSSHVKISYAVFCLKKKKI